MYMLYVYSNEGFDNKWMFALNLAFFQMVHGNWRRRSKLNKTWNQTLSELGLERRECAKTYKGGA